MKKSIQIWAAFLVSLLAAGCASVPRPAVNATAPTAPPYESWARVLEKHVDDQGRVNFVGVARDRADLDRFVAYVYDTALTIAPNFSQRHRTS
jgi:hypothetical protein